MHVQCRRTPAFLLACRLRVRHTQRGCRGCEEHTSFRSLGAVIMLHAAPRTAPLNAQRSVQAARRRASTRCCAGARAQSEPPNVPRRGLLQLATCACCAQLQLPAFGAEWSYGSAVPSGVNGWPAVSKTCAAGSSQSPVDLRVGDVVAEETRPLSFSYAPSKVTVSNPHGGAQVSFAQAQAPTVVLGDRKLELLQFHFHTPSEHALEGSRLAMEAHLVHRDADTGKLAVLGVLMRAAADEAPNACLAAALRYGPQSDTEVVDVPVLVNPAALLPAARTFLEYRGSLTTPPCSEEVRF